MAVRQFAALDPAGQLMRDAGHGIAQQHVHAHRLVHGLHQVVAKVLGRLPVLGGYRLPHVDFQGRHQAGQPAHRRRHDHRAQHITRRAGGQDALHTFDGLRYQPVAKAGELFRPQEQVLIPLRRLDEQIHRLSLRRTVERILKLIVKRLLGGGGVARIAAALADAAVGDHVEQPVFPGTQIEMRHRLRRLHIKLLAVREHRRHGQGVIVGIKHKGQPRPRVHGVNRQRGRQRRLHGTEHRPTRFLCQRRQQGDLGTGQVTRQRDHQPLGISTQAM